MIAFLLVACAKMSAPSGDFQATSSGLPTSDPPAPSQPITPPEKLEPLVWENTKNPDRVTWSAELTRIVDQHFASLDLARDIESFCAPYSDLTRTQRVRVWANLIASVTYFESGWNPMTNSVDVGTGSDRDTWSVGLLQLSVVDQMSYGIQFGFSFADLQKPVPNLELGVAILARQIAKYGIIAIPTGGSGLYWAVLHPGGKYDQTAQISKMTSRIRYCLPGN